jgi:hypothetical protein
MARLQNSMRTATSMEGDCLLQSKHLPAADDVVQSEMLLLLLLLLLLLRFRRLLQHQPEDDGAASGPDLSAKSRP